MVRIPDLLKPPAALTKGSQHRQRGPLAILALRCGFRTAQAARAILIHVWA